MSSGCPGPRWDGADQSPTLTPGVDNLVDFMRVVGMLGIILHHLEADRQVVQSTAEVGLPSGLVVGELVDFSTRHCPRLSIKRSWFSHKSKLLESDKAHFHSGTESDFLLPLPADPPAHGTASTDYLCYFISDS